MPWAIIIMSCMISIMTGHFEILAFSSVTILCRVNYSRHRTTSRILGSGFLFIFNFDFACYKS